VRAPHYSARNATVGSRPDARHAGTGRVERVLPGAELSPDDAIRFGVTNDKPGWLVVLGVDAAGQVTPYAPVSGTALELVGFSHTS